MYTKILKASDIQNHTIEYQNELDILEMTLDIRTDLDGFEIERI